MLVRLAGSVTRRHRAVLLGAVAVFFVAAFSGAGVASELSSGGFEDPSSDASAAERALLEEFDSGSPNLVLVVTARDGDLDGVSDAGSALTEELASVDGVGNVISYWSLDGAAPLRSEDGTKALVLGRIHGDDDVVGAKIREIGPAFEREDAAISVEVGGSAEVYREVAEVAEQDLLRAELIAVPITLLFLLIVFRSVVAALLPLAVGALSVVSALVVLAVVNSFTDVSVFALNLTTAMGLGLAIDYSLFVVSRFREELAHGRSTEEAVQRTVTTAGRTVAFSAGTVAVSLLALLVFPLGFLRSFAYAGLAVAVLAGVYSVTVLPALLAWIGPGIDRWPLRPARTRPLREGFWYRAAHATMRRPLLVGSGVVAILLVLGMPFLRFEPGMPDHRVLPPELESRQVVDEILEDFASREVSGVLVVATDLDDVDVRGPVVAGLAARYSQLEGAARVDSAAGTYIGGQEVPEDLLPPEYGERFAAEGATYLSIVPVEGIEPVSPEGRDLVHEVRSVPTPFPVAVGGTSAHFADSTDSMLARLPLAVGIIAVVTFVLLFMMFGSVLIPAKALVLNVLSLTATFGTMVWIFQDGHLSGLLGFTPTGSIAISAPILMFCIAFGLSMDYEVFLLSRIKEEHDRTGDGIESVAVGLERTGRIVTAAALLVAVVFLAIATSRVSLVQMFGVGLTVAVLVDAFLVRATLIPAFMRLAGEANWWAPGPLRRFHDRFGVSEHVAPEEPAPPVPATSGRGGR